MEWFSRGHEQSPLLNSSAVIAKRQTKLNIFDEQGPQVLRAFGRGPQTMKGWETLGWAMQPLCKETLPEKIGRRDGSPIVC